MMRQADPNWWRTGSFDGQLIREILRKRDVGSVFRFLKTRGWSRAAIAAATGLSETRVRAILQGKQQITSYEVLERVASGLNIDRGLLGLAYIDQDGETARALPAKAFEDAAWRGMRQGNSDGRQQIVSPGVARSDLGTLVAGDELVRRQWGFDEPVEEFLEALMEAIGNGGLSRSVFLRGLLGLSALPLADTVGDASAESRSAEIMASSYTQVAAWQNELYWTSPPSSLYEAAHAHMRLGRWLMADARAAARPTLAHALARSALLAARLAFFDLGRRPAAEPSFATALAAARQAADPALMAAVLGHMAFVPAFARDPGSARALLEAAMRHTQHDVSPTVRSWLYCVWSEVEARNGDTTASRRRIDQAEDCFDPSHPPPDWMDYYDASRLHAFAGYAALGVGEYDHAAQRLEDALHGLNQRGVKQRSVVLADLAMVHARDVDRAADCLHRALDVLNTSWYDVGFDRVRETRRVLGDSQQGAVLDRRINELAAGVQRGNPAG